MTTDEPTTSGYFGRKLREHHAVALSDDDEAIAALLGTLMDVEWTAQKPKPQAV